MMPQMRSFAQFGTPGGTQCRVDNHSVSRTQIRSTKLAVWMTASCAWLALLSMAAMAAPVDSLRVTEIMFNSPVGSDFDFIELQNVSPSETLNLTGVVISEAVDFQFPVATLMAPGSIVIVAKAPGAAFNTHYGLAGVAVYGPYSGQLNNGGERLKIEDLGTEIVDFTYDDGRGWPCESDGAGHSIVPLVLTNQRDGQLDVPQQWRASADIDGSPGVIDAAPPASSQLQINEIASTTVFNNPSFPGYVSNDWVEFFNPTAAALPLTDLYLSDDGSQLTKWAIPAGSLPAGGYLSVDEVTGFNNPMATGFGLSNSGETLFLSHLPAGGPGRVLDCVPFGPLEPNTSWGRFPDGAASFQNLQDTRGSANGPLIEDLVITEFMYHPADTVALTDNVFGEYIEIHNPTGSPVPLSTALGPYEIKGTVDYTFPIGAVVNPGEYVLVVSFDPNIATNRTAFEMEYGLASSPVMFGPYVTKLPNGSGRIALSKPVASLNSTNGPNDFILEELTYADIAPWDANADGTGNSLQRIDFSGAAGDPANWIAATPTPLSTAAVVSNLPPVFSSVLSQSASAGSLLQFGVNATDPNNGQTLTYSLLPGSPVGATINPTTGLFMWTPPGAGNFSVTVVATDDGMPVLTDQVTVMITVIGANTPPTLIVPATVFGTPGSPLTFTATATDPDPGQSFAFAAFAGPAGGGISPSTGQYTWTPTASDLGTQTVTVAVADNGNPAGSDTAQVTLIVTSTPQLAMTDMVRVPGPVSFRLEFPAMIGTSYQIETALDLNNPTWVPGPTMTATSGLGSITLPLNNPPECLLFYRILALP